MLTRPQATALTAGSRVIPLTFFKLWMPYLFQRVEHSGRAHAFLPLNRFYKPLGTQEHVDYSAWIESHGVYFQRDPSAFEGIWFNVDHESGRHWLYNDSQASRLDYFERYGRLMAKGIGVMTR